MAGSSNSTAGSQSTSSQTSTTTSGNGTTSNSTGSQTSTASVGSTTSGNGATTSNSNGNFSGGLPGLGGGSWSSPGSETAAAHASGVQGPGLANGNFGSSWSGNGNSGSGSGDYTYNNTSYSNNKSEPVMTVDEVYGKSTETGVIGNQSIVESQGDYTATSNEKSNVETSTFGKQGDITVTPESVTENKGLVNNEAIESIEGLNFQQKDKESQDVMEARKSRDDVEAEDKANQMRDSLKAKTDETLDEESAKQLQIGEKNDFEEQNNAKLNALNQQKQELEVANKEVKDAEVAAKKAEAEKEAANAAYQKAKEEVDQVSLKTKALDDFLNQTAVEVEGKSIKDRFNLDGLKKAVNFANDLFFKGDFVKGRDQLVEIAKEKGIEIEDISKDVTGVKTTRALETVLNTMKAKEQEALDNQQKAQEVAETARNHLTEVTNKQVELQANYVKAQEDYKTWEAEYWVNDTKTKAEEVANAKSNAEVSFEATKEAINNANLAEEVKSNAIEMINNVEAVTKAVNEAADALAANPNDPATIETYVNAVKTYNESLENALKGNPLAKTDLNKTFTEMVAKANDFDVTLADGTKVNYAEFAAEKAVESPALAKGLYEAKAARLEEEGHPVLARIERAKAEMVSTWLGSKFTFADNQVRNQFIQMAKTDMRATYATYNNILNDPNATTEQKAEASAAINQANALMTASAALQASTGFLSGIGDSMKDGVYGTTNVDDVVVDGVVTEKGLNAYQKTLNAIDNYAKITLGLGVTPSANKAYQNMYYMAGAKVNESGLFGRDFDNDGFALCQEYGNSAAAGMIAGAGELATGVALFFNPAMVGIGLNLVIDSVQTFTNGLYGVQTDARKSQQYAQEVLSYFKEAESIASETGNKEVINSMSATMSNAVKQIENFELKSDEVGNLDNWLEGSGSNTATNEKFNQSLTYDEWLKLIEADPTMRDYAKKLIAEKKEK